MKEIKLCIFVKNFKSQNYHVIYQNYDIYQTYWTFLKEDELLRLFKFEKKKIVT